MGISYSVNCSAGKVVLYVVKNWFKGLVSPIYN
jgi:hypothetical protein